jgi:hypothetical protein
MLRQLFMLYWTPPPPPQQERHQCLARHTPRAQSRRSSSRRRSGRPLQQVRGGSAACPPGHRVVLCYTLGRLAAVPSAACSHQQQGFLMLMIAAGSGEHCITGLVVAYALSRMPCHRILVPCQGPLLGYLLRSGADVWCPGTHDHKLNPPIAVSCAQLCPTLQANSKNVCRMCSYMQSDV